MRTQVVTHGQKIATRVAYFIVFLGVTTTLYIGFLLFAPVKVLEVEVPIPASPTEVQSGGTVNLNFKYCKYKQFESNIKVDFIGEYVIPSLATTRNFPIGCHTEKLAISIPTATPDGKYTLRLSIDYRTNALHTEHYSFESVEIIVSNPQDKPEVEAGAVIEVPREQ